MVKTPPTVNAEVLVPASNDAMEVFPVYGVGTLEMFVDTYIRASVCVCVVMEKKRMDDE